LTSSSCGTRSAPASSSGLLAPAVGFFLVQRRLSLIGDGIGHVAFAGVAVGYLLDLPLVLTALVVSVVGALSIEGLRARRRTAGDQALALVFYTGIAAGVVLISAAGALNVNLFQFLFGSILTVTRTDLIVIAALGAAALALVALLYRPLVAVVVDEEGARVAGLPVPALNALTAALAAVTIALSMRVVGILLIAALMVLPVIAASRIAWSMRSAILIAMAIGLASVLTGITVAYYANLPPGGTTVLVAAAAGGPRRAGVSAGASARRSSALIHARRGAGTPGPQEQAPPGRQSARRPRTHRAPRRSSATRRACGATRRRADPELPERSFDGDGESQATRRHREPTPTDGARGDATLPPLPASSSRRLFPNGARRRGRFRPQEGRSRECWLHTKSCSCSIPSCRSNGRRRSSSVRATW
jgi:zinc transport system permease protein